MLTLSVSACVGGAQPSANPSTQSITKPADNPAKDLTMTLKTPTNALELIENLLSALKSRLVFDETFYTEDSFRRFTGSEDVEVFNNPEDQILQVEAIGFQTLLADDQKSPGEGLSVSVRLETLLDGKKCVSIYGSIRSNQPALYYLDVEKLIERLTGHAWKEIPPMPLGSNQIYREPTDPYGNVGRVYGHQEGGTEETGNFRFEPDGHLKGFFFSLREEQ